MLVLAYFVSFTGCYEDDIFEVISNLHAQESKFGGIIYKCGGKSFKKLEFVFPKSIGRGVGFQVGKGGVNYT